jgi:hypothetical protein
MMRCDMSFEVVLNLALYSRDGRAFGPKGARIWLVGFVMSDGAGNQGKLVQPAPAISCR